MADKSEDRSDISDDSDADLFINSNRRTVEAKELQECSCSDDDYEENEKNVLK